MNQRLKSPICLLERVGVAEAFDVMVFSSDIGGIKPSPKTFEVALETLSVSPKECVVIGDSARRDVGGAEAAGLLAIWGGDSPKHALDSVKDLLELVR